MVSHRARHWIFSCCFKNHPDLVCNLAICLRCGRRHNRYNPDSSDFDDTSRKLCVTLQLTDQPNLIWKGVWEAGFLQKMTRRGGCELTLKEFTHLLRKGCQRVSFDPDDHPETSFPHPSLDLVVNLFSAEELGLSADDRVKNNTDEGFAKENKATFRCLEKLYLILTWKQGGKIPSCHFPLPLLKVSSPEEADEMSDTSSTSGSPTPKSIRSKLYRSPLSRRRTSNNYTGYSLGVEAGARRILQYSSPLPTHKLALNATVERLKQKVVELRKKLEFSGSSAPGRPARCSDRPQPLRSTSKSPLQHKGERKPTSSRTCTPRPPPDVYYDRSWATPSERFSRSTPRKLPTKYFTESPWVSPNARCSFTPRQYQGYTRGGFDDSLRRRGCTSAPRLGRVPRTQDEKEFRQNKLIADAVKRSRSLSRVLRSLGYKDTLSKESGFRTTDVTSERIYGPTSPAAHSLLGSSRHSVQDRLGRTGRCGITDKPFKCDYEKSPSGLRGLNESIGSPSAAPSRSEHRAFAERRDAPHRGRSVNCRDAPHRGRSVNCRDDPESLTVYLNGSVSQRDPCLCTPPRSFDRCSSDVASQVVLPGSPKTRHWYRSTSSVSERRVPTSRKQDDLSPLSASFNSPVKQNVQACYSTAVSRSSPSSSVPKAERSAPYCGSGTVPKDLLEKIQMLKLYIRDNRSGSTGFASASENPASHRQRRSGSLSPKRAREPAERSGSVQPSSRLASSIPSTTKLCRSPAKHQLSPFPHRSPQRSLTRFSNIQGAPNISGSLTKHRSASSSRSPPPCVKAARDIVRSSFFDPSGDIIVTHRQSRAVSPRIAQPSSPFRRDNLASGNDDATSSSSTYDMIAQRLVSLRATLEAARNTFSRET